MIFLVAAFLLLGVLVGAAAHLPPAVALTAGAVLGCWLLIFAYRERRRTRIEEGAR
ncbi:hypothetical protein [Streptomyces armeniacus]|uniref:hypothetical protein n=1 Tax=Streptomyces armeniacus TaxID=83291 RepID=UPI001AD836D0|nr:hypothetical protein [Streptomyces armeniacus]